MTALTVYYTNTTGTTLTSTGQLSITHGTDNVNVTQLYSLLGTATGWGEITALGTTSAWAASGSIGSPTGKGFMLESSILNLSGNAIASGSWTANARLVLGHTDGTLSGTLSGVALHVRVYKYSSGTYTNIIDMALTGQTINNTITTYALSGSTGSSTSFSSGDLLYVDIWANVATNGNADAALNFRNNRLSTNSTGDSNAEVVSPGYSSSGTTVQKDLAFRARVAAQVLKDLTMRARVSAQSQKNLVFRAIVGAQVQRNLNFRALVSAQSLKDLSTRTRVSALNQRNLMFRAIVGNIAKKDLSTRTRVSALSPKDLSTRTLVSAQSQRNLVFRAIVGILSQKNLSIRARVSAQGRRDLALRAIITTIVLPTPIVPATGSFYAGTGGMLPITIPTLPYMINGFTLDTPSICTAPMASNGVMVPAGSVFSLSFVNPSSLTQTVLTTYATPMMTFALYTGEQVTTTVSIQVTTGPVIWQVLCTTLVATQVKRWKVQSQFP